MWDPTLSEADLAERLTLERVTEPGVSPPMFGYGGSHTRWSSYTWKVASIDFIYYNREGKMHRIYGPAYVSRKYHHEKWYKDGILHREGGPAVTHGSTLLWYKDGVLHNLEGPALVDPAGPCQYWIDGVRFSKKQYKWEIARRKRRGLIK